MESPNYANVKTRNEDVLTPAITALGIDRESVLKYRFDALTGEMVIITKEGAKVRYFGTKTIRGKNTATGETEPAGGKDVP